MARTPKVVEDRREQIIEAAMQTFAKKGFANASNKDIAKAAGITPGLIYHYFESKGGLLKAIFEEHSPQRLLHTLPENAADLPPEAFLRLIAQQLLKIVEDEKYVQLARIFLTEAIHNPEMAAIGFTAMQNGMSFLQSYFAAKMQKGELRQADPAMVIQLFGGSLMAMVLRRQILQEPYALKYSQEEIVENLVSLTLHGLLP
jgi:AcrR family transcriptional regulator